MHTGGYNYLLNEVNDEAVEQNPKEISLIEKYYCVRYTWIFKCKTTSSYCYGKCFGKKKKILHKAHEKCEANFLPEMEISNYVKVTTENSQLINFNTIYWAFFSSPVIAISCIFSDVWLEMVLIYVLNIH